MGTTHPDLAREWHPVKNHPHLPSTVLGTASKKFWWKCRDGHEWDASAESRARGTGCPFCAGMRVIPGVNDLATTHPKLLKEWDKQKNHPLEPAMVIAGTSRFLWWICSSGHSWSARGSRRAKGQGCPVCAGKNVMAGSNDLASRNPQLAEQWHPTKNNGVSPNQVTEGSGIAVWWACENGHSWKTSPNRRKSGTGCPVCLGMKTEQGFNDLATTNPDLLKEWHPTKNQNLSPKNIVAGTNKKIWWICKLGHEWQAVGASRLNGTGCPVCSGAVTLSGFNDLASLYPTVAKEWHPTKNLPKASTAQSPGSGTPVWWLCSLGHEWKAGPHQRVNGAGCPVCSGRTVWQGFNDMATTHPDIAAEWHPTKNGNLSPQDFIAGTNKKFWWVCDLGHEWRTSGNARFFGHGCPACSVSGFDPEKPAYFYFIQNLELKARKVGITNVGTDRLAHFQKRGWVVVKLIEENKGIVARELETRVLKWIRVGHGLKPYLARKDMGKRGGWTETFALDGPSNSAILTKIRGELKKLSR